MFYPPNMRMPMPPRPPMGRPPVMTTRRFPSPPPMPQRGMMLPPRGMAPMGRPPMPPLMPPRARPPMPGAYGNPMQEMQARFAQPSNGLRPYMPPMPQRGMPPMSMGGGSPMEQMKARIAEQNAPKLGIGRGSENNSTDWNYRSANSGQNIASKNATPPPLPPRDHAPYNPTGAPFPGAYRNPIDEMNKKFSTGQNLVGKGGINTGRYTMPQTPPPLPPRPPMGSPPPMPPRGMGVPPGMPPMPMAPKQGGAAGNPMDEMKARFAQGSNGLNPAAPPLPPRPPMGQAGMPPAPPVPPPAMSMAPKQSNPGTYTNPMDEMQARFAKGNNGLSSAPPPLPPRAPMVPPPPPMPMSPKPSGASNPMDEMNSRFAQGNNGLKPMAPPLPPRAPMGQPSGIPPAPPPMPMAPKGVIPPAPPLPPPPMVMNKPGAYSNPVDEMNSKFAKGNNGLKPSAPPLPYRPSISKATNPIEELSAKFASGKPLLRPAAPVAPAPKAPLNQHDQLMDEIKNRGTRKAAYAEGGSIKGMRKTAKRLSRHGQGEDKILAHINLEEAKLLSKHFGHDINPHTGLPQFGFFRKLEKALRPKKIEKFLRPVTKTVLPVAGSVIGGMFGGPGGAMLGGSLGGALSSKSHRLDHALGGALVGLGHSVFSPMAAEKFALNPDSFMGKASMMNAPGLGEQLGFGAKSAMSAPVIGKAASSAVSHVPEGEASSGLLSIFKNMGMKDLIDAGLAGTMIAGTLGGKVKQPKGERNLQEMMALNALPQSSYRPSKVTKRKLRKPPPGYRPGHDPEWDYFEHEEVPNPENFAEGGYVDGHSGGQTDDVYTDLPEGSYVMDATTVSLLGDGNSKHGAKRVKQLVDSFEHTGIVRMNRPHRKIKAAISDGEYVISPDEVARIGRGDNRRGSKELDRMRKKLRKQKGLSKFLPPKTKNPLSYMR